MAKTRHIITQGEINRTRRALMPEPTKEEVAALQLLRSGMTIKDTARTLGVSEVDVDELTQRALIHLAYYNPDVADSAIAQIVIDCREATQQAVAEALMATKIVRDAQGAPIRDRHTGDVMIEPDVKTRLLAVHAYRALKESTSRKTGPQVAVNIGVGQQAGGQRFSYESELRRIQAEARENQREHVREVEVVNVGSESEQASE